MNQLLEKLHQQAVDYALEVGDANGCYQGKPYLDVVNEKFAELIVQDCCNLMQGFTFEEIATRVIKHNFGVE